MSDWQELDTPPPLDGSNFKALCRDSKGHEFEDNARFTVETMPRAGHFVSQSGATVIKWKPADHL
jgi:hypothetical protein